MSRAILIVATLGVVVVAFIISTHNYNASQAHADTSSLAPASIPDGSSNDAEMASYCGQHPSVGMTNGVCQFTRHGKVVPVPINQK
jgi:hypothetical protein